MRRDTVVVDQPTQRLVQVLRACHGAHPVRMRPYQLRQVEAVIDRFSKGDSSLILQSATGSGKTTMATELATRWSRRGWVLYVVPRVEIFGQTLAALRGARLQVTELAAGDKTVWPRSGVLLAMGATLQRRLERGIPPPAGVIVDEAHYAPAVAEAIRRCWPRVPMVGLTATPCRLQDAKLASMYQRILPGPQVSDLIAQGYLVPCRTLTAKAPDLRGVRVVAGEYDAAGLGAAFSALVGDVAGTWVKEARGRRTICFAATKDHGRSLVAAYKAKGVKAAFVHAETPADVRESLLSDLRKHRLDVLVNVGLFVEGLDLPEVDCVQLATATRSLARYLQMVGRGMRTAPGKRDLLLLDHGANVELHGLPDDDRVWSLDEDVAVKGGDVPLRACRLCGGLYRVVCHRCHPARRSVPVQVAGSLREVATTRRPAVYVMPSPPRPCPPHLMAWRAVWDRLEQERFARGGATREVDDLIRASVGAR